MAQSFGRFSRLAMVAAAASLTFAGPAIASTKVPQTPLAGNSVRKFVEPLPDMPHVTGTSISVAMREFRQKVLPDGFYGMLNNPFRDGTLLWGYDVNDNAPSYPGRTLVARRHVPTTVLYENDLTNARGGRPILARYLTIDQTLHWADPANLRCMFKDMDEQRAAGCVDPAQVPIPVVVHLHGAEVPSAFDGAPESWFTPDGRQGAGYATLKPVGGNRALYRYPNGQEATTLWYHDHSLGTTRLNVFSGLAGMYLLRDNRDTGRGDNPINLPAGAQERELIIQDRAFDTNGQLLFPDGNPEGINGPPTNPDVHPFWNPEFFGDVIVVNGRSWPYLNLEPRRYRLRIVNASNARMYSLAIRDFSRRGGAGPTIWQIGTDGGFLDQPVPITFPDRLFVSLAERADVIVDFSDFAGKTLLVDNDANGPFPGGDPPAPETTAQILQIRVAQKAGSFDDTCDPASRFKPCKLRASPIVRLPGTRVDKRRQLILKEIEGDGGPLEVLINNTRWVGLKESTMMSNPVPIADSTLIVDNYTTELPRVGATEIWEIANTTEDAHPIHLHLIQFQIINRQPFDSEAYTADYEAAFAAGFQPGDGPPFPYDTRNADGAIGGNLAFSPYLQDSPTRPADTENGWKDTALMPPGFVTRIIARWAPQSVPRGGVAPGQNFFPFDPTSLIGDPNDSAGNPGGPGYVFHCHILDHEDNEMMRPYAVSK